MNKHSVTTGSVVLAVVSTLAAQEKQPATPPAPIPAPPKPSPGLLNEYARDYSPKLDPWDFGGQFRLRYEMKDDFGVSGATDFQKAGVDNDNSYALFRTKVHLGYNHKWF